MDFKDYGKQITILRKQKKISQLQLAKDIHISRATLSSFENMGSSDIGFKKVLEIFDYLGYELKIREISAFPTFEELKNEK